MSVSPASSKRSKRNPSAMINTQDDAKDGPKETEMMSHIPKRMSTRQPSVSRMSTMKREQSRKKNIAED